MKERDYPEGHPSSADYDPDSLAAKDWWADHEKVARERDYPPGHPAATDTPAEKVGDGYKSFVAPDEISLRAGGLCLRAPDVVIIACPLHGDRKMHGVKPGSFTKKHPVVEGDVQFVCGTVAMLVDGVWKIA